MFCNQSVWILDVFARVLAGDALLREGGVHPKLEKRLRRERTEAIVALVRTEGDL